MAIPTTGNISKYEGITLSPLTTNFNDELLHFSVDQKYVKIPHYRLRRKILNGLYDITRIEFQENLARRRRKLIIGKSIYAGHLPRI